MWLLMGGKGIRGAGLGENVNRTVGHACSAMAGDRAAPCQAEQSGPDVTGCNGTRRRQQSLVTHGTALFMQPFGQGEQFVVERVVRHADQDALGITIGGMKADRHAGQLQIG